MPWLSCYQISLILRMEGLVNLGIDSWAKKKDLNYSSFFFRSMGELPLPQMWIRILSDIFLIFVVLQKIVK